VRSALTLDTVIGLIAFMIGSGVIFGTLLLIRRERANRLLILFCIPLVCWSLIYIVDSLQTESARVESLIWWQLVATMVTLTVFTYTLFVSQVFAADDRTARVLITALPIVTLISLITIWAGFVFNPTFDFQIGGWVVLGAGIVYTTYAVWTILTSTHVRATHLRVPGLLMVLSMVSQAFDATRALPIGLACAALALLLIGWSVLRYQLANPLTELSDELRVANRDLRQVVTDLATERGRSAELVKRLDAAQSYGAYKNDFLNALGHRLKTPLNSIVGYSELLESGTYGELSEKQQDRLNKIHRNGDTLLAVINDMLDLNRIDGAQMQLQLHPVNIRDVIDRAAGMVEIDRAAKSISVNVTVGADAALVRGDESRLVQVIAPLLDHAVQAQTGGVIDVKTERIRVKSGIADGFALPLIGWLSDGDWIVLQIHDQSLGIAPDAQPHLFDAFYEFPEYQGQEMQGTGLGLTVAKKLVELHQGMLWVKSHAEQGTTFFLALRVIDG